MSAPIVRPPSLRALASVFARAGNSSFGGGTATIVEIERQVIDRHGWIGRDDAHLAYAISRLAPGTNLLAYCVGVGWQMRGVVGAVVAIGAASLPCAVIATALTGFFGTWAERPITAHALKAALAAAVAIMVGSVWTMIRPYIERHQYTRTLLLSGVAFFAALFAGLTPFRTLVAAAAVGALWTEPDRS